MNSSTNRPTFGQLVAVLAGVATIVVLIGSAVAYAEDNPHHALSVVKWTAIISAAVIAAALLWWAISRPRVVVAVIKVASSNAGPVIMAATLIVALLGVGIGAWEFHPRAATPSPTHHVRPSTPTASTGKLSSAADTCPSAIHSPMCYTPHALRVAYGIEPLTMRGFTGKGQTVIDVVSYVSPTLQKDLDAFSDQFGLPRTTVQVVSPLHPGPVDPSNPDINGWDVGSALDAEMIHAIAPDAHIVVLVSQVDETQGVTGLPEFMQVEQYAVKYHLGDIIAQSWSASEATLTNAAAQQLVKSFASFYEQIVQQGYIVVSAAGNNGAADCAVVNCFASNGGVDPSKLTTTPTIDFPADVPWVTAVGGTSLQRTTGGYTETAWPSSGGGVSKFFPEPAFQQSLPYATQGLLAGQRGLPDVAADADPSTPLAFYYAGSWTGAVWGGTNASTELWAGLFAIADQMAGRPLGNITEALYNLGESSLGQHDFRDITSGDNSVTTSQGTVQGFPAVPGWDMVTGWGSPQADHLIPDLVAAAKA